MFIFRKKHKGPNCNLPITVIKKPASFMTITDIPCYDDENKNNYQKEKEVIQNFLDKVSEKKESVIIGYFCYKNIDERNRQNIIKKINLKNKKKKDTNKKQSSWEYFYLKKINISTELFEIPSWHFPTIIIWRKETFNEASLLKSSKKYFDSSDVLCQICGGEMECLEIIISDEILELRNDLIKNLQSIGYKIKERKF